MIFFNAILLFVFCLLLNENLASVLKIESHYPTPSLPVSMFIRGTNCGLSWESGLKMDKLSSEDSAKTTWSISLNCLETVTNLEIKVLIDDKVWMIGANHHINLNSATQTDTYVDEIYPWFYNREGTLTIIKNVYSKELGNYRDVIFYLPPSYTENIFKSYKNILIMHDGQNLFNAKTTAFGTAWMCQDTLNELIVSAKSDELIIAGAYNTADRINEYTYVFDPSEDAGGKGDLYLDWIESTLIPLIQTNFRVSMSRDTTGILGSSLGGLISCYGGWTRPSVYGKVGCMSSSFWWDDLDFQTNVITKSDSPSTPSYPIFYMDAGTGSVGEVKCDVYTSEIYDYAIGGSGSNLNFTENVNIFKYTDKGGKHNEASWGARFYIPMEALFPPSTV